MSTHHRQLLFVSIACIALVFIAAVVKMDDQVVLRSKPIINMEVTSPTAEDNIGLDESFLVPTVEIPEVTQSVTQAPEPRISAKAYLVGNVHTGEIYLEQNISRVLPVASMSKLVTAFVATDVLSATSTITITQEAVFAPQDSSNLLTDEQFELQEILLPLLMNSSNVAAESIASATEDRTTFMELMSSYAWEIGMPDAYFADPSGVNPQNVASARGLFALAKYLVNSRQDILQITKIASSQTATTTLHGSHQYTNTHPFVRDSRFVGGKTGRTPEAGETMMTILNIDGETIVCIVLGSKYGYREKDTRLLFEDVEKILSRRSN